MTGLFQPSSIRSGVFAFVVGLIMLCGLPGVAQAACSAPAGAAGEIGYNSTAKTFQYCDGTGWVRMNKPGSGSGGCTNPTLAEGQMGYNRDARVLQGCAGDVHRAMGPVGGVNEWKQIDAGSYHTCAVKTNGTLWCWGSDGADQLGNGAVAGNQLSPMQESTAATDWASVSTGNFHSCAVKANGTLWCWGNDGVGQLGNGVAGSQVSPMQEFTSAADWASVSAGSSHTCAVKTNGTLWCWGSDTSGQLGNGAAGSQVSPMQESTAAADWASVSAGSSHTCAVKTNGTLWCWGSDSNGQLGNGAAGAQVSPMQESTAATDWTSVSAGNLYSCAVKTNGTLWCWGSDGNGQLGNGAAGAQVSPMQESTVAADWAAVSAGNSNTCAVKTDGTLWCWGYDGGGQLGNGAVTGNQVSPMQEFTVAADWAAVSAGNSHTCAVKTDGTLWCWGSDGNGQLGNGAVTGNQVSPMQESTAATIWASVSAGINHTCAVKANGTLWCWGYNGSDQLGNGVAGNQVSPMQESTAASNWASVSAGDAHTCAVKTDGTLWCWGDDWSGQLGNGAAGNQVSPMQESTAAADWASVSAGSEHTCAVKTNGTLWCWGGDVYDQLGNGAAGAQVSPMQESTAASNWASISVNYSHSCAVKIDGTLWCWGADWSGQLGNGAAGSQVSPMQESTAAADWASVNAGGDHTCAVKTDGTLWCWGFDGAGRLGNGAAGDQASPMQESTAASNWASVSAGDAHTCAVKTDGTLWCWGRDASGQLGNGAAMTGNQVNPVAIGPAWSGVEVGANHSCAIGASPASLFCWGSNTFGQLGAGIALGDSPVLSDVCATLNDKDYPSGAILYNSDFNVMQYCDGAGWVKIRQ